MSTIDLLNSARTLSVEDRIELVQAIWDSIAQETPPPPDKELRAELDRRIAAHEANPSDVLTWEQIRHRVRIKP